LNGKIATPLEIRAAEASAHSTRRRAPDQSASPALETTAVYASFNDVAVVKSAHVD
jgi:hypothetical protein